MPQGRGENDVQWPPAHFSEGVWKYLSRRGSTSGPIEEGGVGVGGWNHHHNSAGSHNGTTTKILSELLLARRSQSDSRGTSSHLLVVIWWGFFLFCFFICFFFLSFFHNGRDNCHSCCESDRQVSTVQVSVLHAPMIKCLYSATNLNKALFQEELV